ncbi:MAG TPA: YbhN family protein [Solirubrobacteraceae bacterium]|nr:YbhN family protein [Solirubrobacteraceae bacterium]
MASVREPETERPAAKRPGWRHIATRVFLLILSGVSLYLLAPKLVSVLASWPQLKALKPAEFGLALLFEAMSYLSLWAMQRVALHTTSWFAVGTTQLASGAIGSIVPGGAATAGAAAYRMLTTAGVRSDDVASGLAASTVASTATVFAMPLLALPAIIGGVGAPRGLLTTAYVGAAGFVAFAVLSAAAFGWDAPLLIVARSVRWLIQRVRRDSAADLPEHLLAQRDRMKQTFGRRWYVAVTGAVGKVGFDYLALVCCLAAVGARPHPSLVLLAYIAGALLALIPVTPGGLGFVEAGLTGMLTAAGVSAQHALVSTLAYRVVSFWVPLPAGGIAYLLFRRRYGEPEAGDSSTSSTVP